ncbi:hypothetical protein LXA43DRAFT_970337 [Ganoderma leucocontextum]|nr:hypothetical protein LXA43DRAFT_970337 [Ganoderma leucocontextum]
MPLDILLEVFSFMHPRDLLSLARTTRDFRTFLFSRSSAPFWKSARKNAEGLPDCPQYLSEPAYANLMFFAHCHNCLRSNIQNILFEFSARYCRDCQRSLLMEGGEVDCNLDQIIVQLGFHEDYLTPVTVTRDSTDRTFFHRHEYDNFLDACQHANDDDELVSVIQDNIAHVRMIHETCGPLYAWKEAQVQDRAQELDRLRGDRFAAITDFLSAEGWADEISRMGEEELNHLADKPYARKPAKLTERGELLPHLISLTSHRWKSIREDAHAFMEDVRLCRLQRERHQLIFDRFSTLAVILDDLQPEYPGGAKRAPEDDLQPQFADYALLAEVRRELDDPGDALVPADRLSRVWEDQDALINQWKRTIQDELIDKLRAVLTLPEDVDDPLSLAIASFACRECHRSVPLRYPGLLTHGCLRPERFVSWNEDLYEATVEVFASAIDSQPALNLDKIAVDAQMIQRLTAIIETLGLDPLHTSQDELEHCEGRMFCAYIKCQTESSTLLNVTGCDWLSAVCVMFCYSGDLLHMNGHETGRVCEFRILGEREAARVRQVETAVRGRFDGMESDYGVQHRACSFCPKSFSSWYSLISHLQFAHDVDTQQDLKGSFYIPLDEQLRQLPRIYVCYDMPIHRYRGVVLQKGWHAEDF